MSHLPNDERFDTMEVEIPPSLPPDMSEIQPHERPDISQYVKQQNADNKRVGPNLGESSGVKTRKTRSKVWENFDRYQDENGKVRARCKVCGNDFDGSSTSGTTRLRNHFTSCQRKRNNLAGNLSDVIAIKKKPTMDQPLNHLDAARMIIKQGDASCIDSTDKGYIIELYNEEKEKLRNYFEKLSCRLCLTFFKSTFREDRYSCLMIWFIDDDWKLKNKILKPFDIDETVDIKDIKNVLLEWGIENNLSSMVIDCDDYRCLPKRDDWSINQGSLLFNNKLLCCEAFLVNFDYFLDDELRGSLRGLVNDIIEPSSCGPGNINLMGVVKNALGLKDARFELANIDPRFQILTKEKWVALRAIYEYYEEWDFLEQYRGNYNTANIYFPLLCSAYKCCKEFRKCHINFGGDDLIEGAWRDYNLVLAVASVLDPRFKMDIVKNWYKEIFGDDWEKEFANFNNSFTDIYSGYYAREIKNFKSCTPGSEETNSSISYKMLDPLGKPCKSSYEPNHVQLLKSDLDCYLKEGKFPSFEDFDILEWWRVHARCFPTLARMARDFLSIQISSPYIVLDDEKPLLEEFGIEEAYICTNSWLAPEEMSSSLYLDGL